MSKRTLLLLSASFIAGLSFAQNLTDAYRFSSIHSFGSSRSAGLGGAMGALGGDFHSASFNPAGIVVFPESNFNMDLKIKSQENLSNYHNNNSRSNSSDFVVNSVGFVKAFKNTNKPVALGIGVNHLNNFNSYTLNEAYNFSSSRLFAFEENADGFTPDQLSPFKEQLAFNTYLLDYDGAGNQYKTPLNNAGQDEYYSLRKTGNVAETLLALAYKPSDETNVGFAIGFPSYTYEESSHYRESNFQDSTSLDYFSYRTFLRTSASGVNLKFGMQYKATNFLRLGFAFHSPTWYTVTEDFSAQMSAQYKDSSHVSDSPIGFYEYRVNTPMRVMGSAAVILGTRGLLSIEHEIADFSQTLFKQTGVFQELNNDIANNFSTVHTTKLGGELNLFPLQLRAGFVLSGTPFNPDTQRGIDASLQSTAITAGMSMSFRNWRFDLSYLNRQTNKYSLVTYEISGYESGLDVEEVSQLFNFGLNYQF